jgi:hypothetical protein
MESITSSSLIKPLCARSAKILSTISNYLLNLDKLKTQETPRNEAGTGVTLCGCPFVALIPESVSGQAEEPDRPKFIDSKESTR